MVPTLDKATVPPASYSLFNFYWFDNYLSILISLSISTADKYYTFLMFGATNPLSLSIAIEILWLKFTVYENY